MGDTPDQFRQGDELSASRLNEWAGYASGSPLEAGEGMESATGSKRLLAARRARPIVAKLAGSSSPYSWTSQANTATGTYANHAITGTTNAYEVNGVSGLANKVVRLYPDGHGKFNFQYLNCCGGGGGGPITCICWHDGDRPATLSYTADFYYSSTSAFLGSTSGTLSYMNPITYAKTGGGTCTLSTGVAGWIADWTDYCGIPDAFGGVTATHRPQCLQDAAPAVCSATSGTRCRYLFLTCAAITDGSGSSSLGIAETYYNSFTSTNVCGIAALYLSPTSGCSPFSINYYGGAGYFGISVDLTITL